MFNRIPSDVSEIVVVYTRCYDVYLEMREIVEKFKNECVQTRIRDKLTVKCFENGEIVYKLGNDCNREYGKPYSIEDDTLFVNSHFSYHYRL